MMWGRKLRADSMVVEWSARAGPAVAGRQAGAASAAIHCLARRKGEEHEPGIGAHEVKYLDKLIEQDQQAIKFICPMLGFKWFRAAQ
jgi:transposase-like protein